jgi:signal-transduction protein with cAMP-binding, CBS, and nucleotidyltransferase domain
MPQNMTRVSELMTRDVIDSIEADATVREASERMKKLKRSCLVVIRKGHPVGIITERDLVQRVIADCKPVETKVSEVMSSPLITLGPEALVSDAANVMTENGIRRLPIVENDQVVGMITATDFARFLHRKSGSDPMLAAMARAAVLLATP